MAGVRWASGGASTDFETVHAGAPFAPASRRSRAARISRTSHGAPQFLSGRGRSDTLVATRQDIEIQVAALLEEAADRLDVS